jgi:hypothetical protein
MLKNWKTSLFGLLAAAIATPQIIAVVENQLGGTGPIDWQRLGLCLLVGALGLAAKDFDSKTGVELPADLPEKLAPLVADAAVKLIANLKPAAPRGVFGALVPVAEPAEPVDAKLPLGGGVVKIVSLLILFAALFLSCGCAELKKGVHYLESHPAQDIGFVMDVASDVANPANIVGQVEAFAASNPSLAADIGPSANSAAIYKAGEILTRTQVANGLEQSIHDVTDDDSADGIASTLKAEVLKSLPAVVTGEQANKTLAAVSRHAATGLQKAAANSVP